MAIFRLGPPNGGVDCMWGRKNGDHRPSLHRVFSTAPRPSVTQLRRTVASWRQSSLQRRRLLFTGDDDEVFMTRRLDVTPKTTEQNLMVRRRKSEAAMNNSKQEV